VQLHYSPLESARFGLRVFRGRAVAIDAPSLHKAIDTERVDVAILRMPVQSPDSLVLLAAAGLAPIVADTLVHYDIDLQDDHAAVTAISALRLRPAGSADAALIESMTREIFAGYSSHYRENPLFRPADILEGYAQWASSHVRASSGGAAAWIVEADSQPLGFSCYRIDHETRRAIGVLNGILPAARGRGVYRDMLRRMLVEFGKRGARRFAIATQVGNSAVQRVWIGEGLQLRKTENTIHFNVLRG